MTKITLQAQLLAQLPCDEINKIAQQRGSNKRSKGIDTWSHLVFRITPWCWKTAIIT